MTRDTLRALGERLDRERTSDARLLERLARPKPRLRRVCVACRRDQSTRGINARCWWCPGRVVEVEA